MDKHHPDSNFTLESWTNLTNKYSLSSTQVDQLKRYLELLITWNNKFNLTAITKESEIIQYHFDDSLAISTYIDLSQLKTIADVGTGAGFPGLALKILFPHLKVILIEVNSKKRSFLAHVAQELSLHDVTLYPHDWRTFLRTTDYTIDTFVARASLQPEELVRIFKPSSIYKNALFIYWASIQWKAGRIEAPFVEKEIIYTLDTVQRKFILFSAPPSISFQAGTPAKSKKLSNVYQKT